MEWRRFGWQGFLFPVPPGWELAAQQGEFEKGYFRLNDSTMPRLEVKWERKRRPPDLESMERAYRTGLKKAKGLESLAIRDNATGTSPTGPWRRFRWQGKVIFDDVLLSCTETRRAVVLRLFSPSRQKGEELIRKIVAEFEDLLAAPHTIWTAYDFACRVPAGYRLRRSDLRAGFLMLRFGTRRDQVEFQRLRLGTIPESDRDIDLWGERVLGKAEKEEGSWDYVGHAGRVFRLGTRRIIPRLRRPLQKPAKDAWLWRCPESESLYLVKQSTAAVSGPKAWRVWCHEDLARDIGRREA